MNNLHIVDSYNTWSFKKMKKDIDKATLENYNSNNPREVLNRTYAGMYVEWAAHNIGYYVTKPLTSIKACESINRRCKDVDLQEIKRK